MLRKTLLFCSIFASASFAPFIEDVKSLTDVNYRDFLDNNENVFVKFFKP